jgi:hypothetical protein
VTLVRTDDSVERVAYIVRVTIIGELGTLAVTSNFPTSVFRFLGTAKVFPKSPILVTLMMEAIRSSETSVPTRATRRHIAEDGVVQSELNIERLQAIADIKALGASR